MAPDPNKRHEVVHGPFQAFARTTQFWRRATGIYLSYKGAQVKAQALKLQGWDQEKLKEVHWKPHHTWAGKEMHSLCVDMRGFYLKVLMPAFCVLTDIMLFWPENIVLCIHMYVCMHVMISGGPIPWGKGRLHAATCV